MATNGRKIIYLGVSFESVRWALFNVFFYQEGMQEKEVEELSKYVVPMQHNFDNPLQGDAAKDTFIEYWISRDSRIAQDYNHTAGTTGENAAWKLAEIDVRFVGVEAETWAKAFHHITQRPRVAEIFADLCRGEVLEFVGDIIPVNIDYYGVGNSSIAFDLSMKIKYNESVKLNWKPLEYISLAPGEIISGGLGAD